eukprot:1596388-Pyramimonas_sp.AAC.1
MRCGTGEQWQRALSPRSKMWKATLQPDAISYNADISARGKVGQRAQVLPLLSEIRGAKFEPDVISYSAGISARGGGW